MFPSSSRDDEPPEMDSFVIGKYCRMWSNETVYHPRVTSLYLTEWQLVVYFLGLLLILTVAALALWTARLFHGTPTAAVGAHRLSSKCQSGYHRRSGRFVVKNPLDFAHYVRV
ncbi:hypothetical protein ALC57_03832 [Trachymyrmex cornetzi]|uniref:Uncharacterized protein n=1 Tax=Trachymyrmex cornetzi TaxID=471704 RepID=A0A195EF56_9HYME|nr:hypothetical protein ALC57_03832 [Trachymyrmex cornetzi]